MVPLREATRLLFTLSWIVPCAISFAGMAGGTGEVRSAPKPRHYEFDGTISREVLENYLSRSISMEGLLNGRGDLDDNIRMLKETGAKFIGRGLCLWGREGELVRNLERAKQQVPKVHAADPDMILQACIFEIVSTHVDQVPVPEWAFLALGQLVKKRNFRYADMLYPDGKRVNQWGRNASVPDVSRPETKLWSRRRFGPSGTGNWTVGARPARRRVFDRERTEASAARDPVTGVAD